MNKTVLITGASRGIGAATAIFFAKKGFHVGINYHKNEEAAKKVLQEVENAGQKGILLPCDVADAAQVAAMVKTCTKALGTISVLVNNAGIALSGLFTDITQEQWTQLFNVNVYGMFHTTNAVLPQMIHEKQGAIVNVSSVWGICGASCEVHYSAAKAAIIGATKALAQELAPSNIRVNCVAPGVIDTEMNKHLSKDDMEALKEETPLGKIGTPEDVAKAIYFLASNDAAFITGQVLSPNGGFVI